MAQELIIRIADFQRKLNFLHSKLASLIDQALIGKEWDPNIWDRDLSVDALEYLEIPGHTESSAATACPLPSPDLKIMQRLLSCKVSCVM